MSVTGIVLVTGANRGLGLGLAREFADRGWRVLAGCRRVAAAAQLAQLDSSRITVLELDVSDDASVRAALARATEIADRLDVLINNAGINPEPRTASVAEVPLANVAAAFDVNVLGALRVLQATVPLLRRSARPRIINIASGAGSLTRNAVTPVRPQLAYCLSKAALNRLTRAAARDLPGMVAVSISPGWIRTEMGGPEAELSVEEAAVALATTVENLDLSHTGEWLDRFGHPSEFAW